MVHDQLFSNACKLVDEQIKAVNQELLLEKMHQTEECDQLLVDDDIKDIIATNAGRLSIDDNETNVSKKFFQRPSSLIEDFIDKHDRNVKEQFADDDDHTTESDVISDIVRYKFRPGHFACPMVWHRWFRIHPRLHACRYAGGTSDIGFKALRAGLEVLAVKNRSNLYVFKESNGNIVYIRLHSTEETIFANIPHSSPSWIEEVRQNVTNAILLSVHGVNAPGEEVTESLMGVIKQKLNIKTLEEIQTAILKNAQIRLEWSDVEFIQKDSQKPTSLFFFTVPEVAQGYLASVRYYLNQQLLTFCIAPKFREQSGPFHARFHSHRKRSPAYLSGGTSNRRSRELATMPSLTPDDQHQFAVEPHAHCFLPYQLPNASSSPKNYVPTFYLINKHPG
jgi:hypothetical protein